MKKMFTYFGFLSIVSFTLLAYLQSCKHENVENIYSLSKDEMLASFGVAKEVAENINKSPIVLKTTDRNLLLKSANYLGKRKIKSTLTIADKDKIPYFYVFNYELGGFSIVPADQRIDPNLAYSEIGSFSLDSIPDGIVQWLNANALHIRKLRATNAKQSATVNYLWSDAQCTLNLAPSPSTPGLKTLACPPPPCASSNSSITIGPLLKTTWDQGCYYNTYCPILNNGPCGYAYTGCSTVAVAQVMYYWKYPSTYNWSGMTLTSGNDAVALLMGDIFSYVISSYDTNGSNCSNDYNIEYVFLKKYVYKSATLAGYVNGITENGGYNYSTVQSNLNGQWPVILGAYDNYRNILGLLSFPRGSGHTWVCDGYVSNTYNNCPPDISYSTLQFHMNWGWSGLYDGWYNYDSWDVDGDNYVYYPDMIYNIHP